MSFENLNISAEDTAIWAVLRSTDWAAELKKCNASPKAYFSDLGGERVVHMADYLYWLIANDREHTHLPLLRSIIIQAVDLGAPLEEVDFE